MSRTAVLLRKWQSFQRFPLLDKLMIPVVFILLGIARAAILLLPFRYYSRFLGENRQTDIFTPLLTPQQVNRSRRIGRAIRATAKITPWESLCLVQALVASILLRIAGLPYILHFGLAKNHDPSDPNAMKAHAWITAGQASVTGGRSLFKFAVVGSYVSPLLSDKT